MENSPVGQKANTDLDAACRLVRSTLRLPAWFTDILFLSCCSTGSVCISRGGRSMRRASCLHCFCPRSCSQGRGEGMHSQMKRAGGTLGRADCTAMSSSPWCALHYAAAPCCGCAVDLWSDPGWDCLHFDAKCIPLRQACTALMHLQKAIKQWLAKRSTQEF